MCLFRTVCEIFSVRRRDLEILGQGSFKVTENCAVRYRLHTTYYWSAIVSIALSCTIFKLFDVDNIVILKSGLKVVQGHCKWHNSIDCTVVPIGVP